MKTLKIHWKKEVKNSVPFFVYVNGRNCCMIRRGESCTVNVGDDITELYFVPKAPKFFGWFALKIQAKFVGPTPMLQLGVMNEYVLDAQLHSIHTVGVTILSEQQVKKYN